MSATRLVVAQDDQQQCSEYQFDTPFFPGDSCEDIYNKNPQSRDKSGYYWILDGPSRIYCGMNYTGSSCEDTYVNNVGTRDKSGYYRINNTEWVYCNMRDMILSCAGVDGVWKRIAGFNITAGDECPSPWVKSSHNGVNFCTSANIGGGCNSVTYSTNGTSYQRVCGRASGYQKGSPDAFGRLTNAFDYFEGLSITHSSPCQHIWTYAVGLTDSGTSTITHNCPCNSPTYRGIMPPDFVGSDYYCESGAESSWTRGAIYLSDVLWDGAGCSAGNTCCSDPKLPWFYRQLSDATQDDIEARICMDQQFDDEAVLITNLELYIQ